MSFVQITWEKNDECEVAHVMKNTLLPNIFGLGPNFTDIVFMSC